MRRLILLIALLALPALACDLAAAPPPTPLFRTATPRPPGYTAPPQPGPSDTPLGIFGPSRTPDVFVTPTPDGSHTATPTETETGTPTLTPPPAQPLVVQWVEVAGIRRDASRPNGSLVSVRVVLLGGLPPFTFTDENQPMPGNPYEVPSACPATLTRTVRVLSADGQSATYPYYLTADCP